VTLLISFLLEGGILGEEGCFFLAARARMEKEDKHNSLQSESPRSPTPPPTKRQKIQPAQKKQPSSRVFNSD
jgi:hypothetical protein